MDQSLLSELCVGISQMCICSKVTDQDLENFNKEFYMHTKKIDQDNMLAKFLKVQPKKKKKPKKNGNAQGTAPKTRAREAGETSFFVKTVKNKKLRVCKQFFLKALSVGRTRVENIAKHCFKNAGLRKENRGGDRKEKLFSGKREAVYAFLKQLTARESHYDRKKTQKLYLDPSIRTKKKLWRLYTDSNTENPVTYEYFRRIFTRKFRIGFGSPKTDACSTCERLENQIRLEKDLTAKQKLLTEKRIHKKRANAFYDLINERREGLKTFCFDHQQNQVLPKVPDQIAYYSRQLYVYNFSVVEMKEDGKLSPENVFIYTWKECDFAKNSSSCASAVFHALNNSDMNGVDTIRLISDACGGQNKNSSFLYMASHYLCKHAPPTVKNIEFVFPVRGHSFLPCDRAFGVVELDLRKKERIYTPEEYLDIFKSHGTVRVGGQAWDVFNFKESTDKSFKKPLPIKIQESKRFYVTKAKTTIQVRAEPNFKNDINQPQILLRKGQSFKPDPNFVPIGVEISEAKKADIKKLIEEHVGTGWENDERFNFLKGVISGTVHQNTAASTSAHCDEEMCTCLGEDEPADRV